MFTLLIILSAVPFILMATWPGGINIIDATIAVGQPLTEDLMHDYRDRDDYLFERQFFPCLNAYPAAGASGDDLFDIYRYLGHAVVYDGVLECMIYLPPGMTSAKIRFRENWQGGFNSDHFYQVILGGATVSGIPSGSTGAAVWTAEILIPGIVNTGWQLLQINAMNWGANTHAAAIKGLVIYN